MKVIYALKSTGILLFSVGLNTVDRDLNQYNIAVPLFGVANAAPNKGTTISYSFSSTNFSIISVQHFEEEFLHFGQYFS